MTNITLDSGYRITLDTSKIGRYAHRNIITVNIQTPENSPKSWNKDLSLYQSSGINSGNQGRWYPFDGLTMRTDKGLEGDWFRKDQYINTEFENDQSNPLYRLGASNLDPNIRNLFLEISEALVSIKFSDPLRLIDNQVNPFLGTQIAMEIEKHRVENKGIMDERRRVFLQKGRLERENTRQFALR